MRKSLGKVAKWLGRFQTIIGVIAIILGILYFGLQGIVAIIAGLILAIGILTSIPAIGKDLEKVAKWLGGFQTTIGVVAIVVGVLYFGLQGITAIVSGLILALGLLPSIPAIGKDLARVVKWLGSFQTIIGVIAIVLGIWGLLF